MATSGKYDQNQLLYLTVLLIFTPEKISYPLAIPYVNDSYSL